MKKLLVTCAAFVALAITAHASVKRDVDRVCRGKVISGGLDTDEVWIQIGTNKKCRLSIDNVQSKGILDACPIGSVCEANFNAGKKWARAFDLVGKPKRVR